MRPEYEAIVDLPHVQSRTRPRMSREERAAQFSPFAALTGFEEAIRETERQSGEEPDGIRNAEDD